MQAPGSLARSHGIREWEIIFLSDFLFFMHTDDPSGLLLGQSQKDTSSRTSPPAPMHGCCYASNPRRGCGQTRTCLTRSSVLRLPLRGFFMYRPRPSCGSLPRLCWNYCMRPLLPPSPCFHVRYQVTWFPALS